MTSDFSVYFVDLSVLDELDSIYCGIRVFFFPVMTYTCTL